MEDYNKQMGVYGMKQILITLLAIAEQNVFCILTMDWYLLHTTTTKHFMKFQIKEQTYVSI